jgi:hypothetical protein
MARFALLPLFLVAELGMGLPIVHADKSLSARDEVVCSLVNMEVDKVSFAISSIFHPQPTF